LWFKLWLTIVFFFWCSDDHQILKWDFNSGEATQVKSWPQRVCDPLMILLAKNS